MSRVTSTAHAVFHTLTSSPHIAYYSHYHSIKTYVNKAVYLHTTEKNADVGSLVVECGPHIK